MSADRFLDRFRFFSAEKKQIRAVGQLYEVIRSSDQGAAILDEQAPWAVTYSSKPSAPPTPEPLPPAPAVGLDPRGSEEAGMAGPQKPAPVKPGDSYLLVNDRDDSLTAKGSELVSSPSLAGTALWRLISHQASKWKRYDPSLFPSALQHLKRFPDPQHRTRFAVAPQLLW